MISHQSLAAILSILRHVAGFYTSVTGTLGKKGENASELEHLVAQVMFKVNQFHMEKFFKVHFRVNVFSYRNIKLFVITPETHSKSIPSRS